MIKISHDNVWDEKKKWEERRALNVQREDETRKEYERDFARIIHCAAFRRLQGKTQVLGLGDSDFYRTRLTHSMEVSQVSTAITTTLKEKARKGELKIDYKFISRFLPDFSLISAIGLAHDLGHPPFGHGGEIALNYCMRKYGGFEGNGQTLRILTRLEKYVYDAGMNPTRRLLLGILKYPISYEDAYLKNGLKYKNFSDANPFWLIKQDDYKPPKCYLDTENDIVRWILKIFEENDINLFQNKNTNKLKYYRSLDASIMDLADDICYSIHDLEDAISLNIISKNDFFDILSSRENNNENIDSLFDEIDSAISLRYNKEKSIERTINNLFSKDAIIRKESIGRLIHLCIINCQLKYNENFSSILLGVNAKLEDPFCLLQKRMHNVINKLVIKSPNVQQLEFKGQRIVIELFKAIETGPKRFLPDNTLKKFNRCDNEKEQKRVICDYIAGMTDEYALKLYERIFSPHRGSVFDCL